ncbi:hypothetical protein FOY51_06890 [Antrihabitans cavernicola]|uniref:ARB-07466-like C-terminal domain-containing protein n=1 Tax=Antrihabitans cavernicola TaxID=2495913 RepID=A0A5A7SE08_9NOCA|nr:hypothetical protein FOY51_06890 [Spelaeibacter cavernicola]
MGIVLGQPEQEQRPESSAVSSKLTTSTATTTSAAPTTTVAPLPPPPPTSEAPPPPPPLPPILRELCSTVLKGAQPHVAMAGNMLREKFGIVDVGGAEGRYGADDHSTGMALDFMISDSSLGDALANYVLNNQGWLNVNYVIWQQRYNDGSGWSFMEDRGSPTQNHYDHVHVSFNQGGPLDLTC